MTSRFTGKLWSMYADYLYTRWEKTFLWDMIEPYRRPTSFTPLVTIYVAAFYLGLWVLHLQTNFIRCIGRIIREKQFHS